MLKAIETEYNGYRFRSRLEARWAVFFDRLGIEWDYEKEGYDMEGIRYLPDFWLPEYDCFVEIKGQEPTREETKKALLLSLLSGKKVYIFCSNTRLPDIRDIVDEYTYERAHYKNAYQFDTSDIYLIGNNISKPACMRLECKHEKCPNHVEFLLENECVSPEVNLLSRMHYASETLLGYGDSCMLKVTHNKRLQFISPQGDILPLPPLIKEYEQKYLQLILEQISLYNNYVKECSSWEFCTAGWGNIYMRGSVWAECSHRKCSTLRMANFAWSSPFCSECGSALYHDTPRLIEAYTAACQARFEYH